MSWSVGTVTSYQPAYVSKDVGDTRPQPLSSVLHFTYSDTRSSTS